MIVVLVTFVAFIVFVAATVFAYAGATMPPTHPDGEKMLVFGLVVMVVSGIVFGSAASQSLPL